MNKHSLLALSILAGACATVCAQTAYLPTAPEYLRSTTAVQLGLSAVHSLGITGGGALVAVLDTGLNRNNPEFLNNARIATGFNATNGGTDVTDNMGHGTHVAGIIAAGVNGSGLIGVAPTARIVPIKVFGASTASAADIDRGLNQARLLGARVVNLSLGATGPTGTAALKMLTATNNTVVVAAAGNNALANPDWPARYAKESWANGTVIAVGAVDSKRNIAPFSNRAGDAANFFLVAPGVSIYSSYGSGYALMSGTSMAAPAVSGAAALISGYWPYLKANQVANILLTTADDLGAKGVDAVYGRGMLNVSKALLPQNSVTYVSGSGTKTVVSVQALGVPLFKPTVASAKAFSQLSTQVFDEFGRNYQTRDGASTTGISQMTLDTALGRTDRLLDGVEQTLPDGSRVMRLQTRTDSVMSPWSAAMQATPHAVGQEEPQWRKARKGELGSMVSVQSAGTGLSLAAGDGGLGSMAMGLSGSSLGAQLGGTERLLVNPLMAYSPAHQFASLGMALGHGWTGRVGTLRATDTERAHGNVNLMEVTQEGAGYAVNVSMAQLNETGLLGGYSSEAYGLNQTTHTTGLTFSGAYAVAPGWTVTGAWSMTRTAAPAASGLLTQASEVRAQGHGVGLVKSDTWRTGDRLSLTVQTPLGARSGQLVYSVVEGVDADTGAPRFGQQTVNLKTTSRELLTEARYVTRLGRDSQITCVAAWRQNPDHDGSAPAQLLVGARYQKSF